LASRLLIGPGVAARAHRGQDAFVADATGPGPVSLSRLCHLCGSTTFEQVDASHVRCVECGHGATVTRLVAVANPNPSPADLARAEERFRDIDARTVGTFTRAPFRPFALDDRWSGLRWFGGHGGSGDRTTSLGLAFGEDVRDLSAPEIRVETRVRDFDAIDDPVVAAKMDAFMLARHQVDHLWRQTGVLRDDVRRSVFPRDGARTGDPTLTWDHVSLPVDDGLVEFAALREGKHWVAQAIIGERVVGIQARNWELDATGLVTETDFAAYEEGAKEIRRRMTP
jgi:hypothetical protein